MQKSILNFSANALSREEMKQVNGGSVSCAIAIDGVSSSGACGSSSVSECYGYADAYCNSLQGFIETCIYSCWQN